MGISVLRVSWKTDWTAPNFWKIWTIIGKPKKSLMTVIKKRIDILSHNVARRSQQSPKAKFCALVLRFSLLRTTSMADLHSLRLQHWNSQGKVITPNVVWNTFPNFANYVLTPPPTSSSRNPEWRSWEFRTSIRHTWQTNQIDFRMTSAWNNTSTSFIKHTRDCRQSNVQPIRASHCWVKGTDKTALKKAITPKHKPPKRYL